MRRARPAACVHALATAEAPRAPPRSFTVDSEAWPPRFTKALFTFDDGTQLAFADPRRLGRIRLHSGAPTAEPPLSELGPDALTGGMTAAVFAAACVASGAAIKALLLDQSVVAGLGNWLADEVLYQAAIHPEVAANALSSAQVATLFATIRVVLAHAVSVDADSSHYPPTWLFAHRWSKGSSKPVDGAGRAITFVTVGGRTSAVVLAVQRLRGAPAVGAGAGAGATLLTATATAAGAAAAAAAGAAAATVVRTVASVAEASIAGRKRRRPSTAAAAATATNDDNDDGDAAAAAALSLIHI